MSGSRLMCSPTGSLKIGSEVVERVDRLAYLASSTRRVEVISVEMSGGIGEAGVGFAESRHRLVYALLYPADDGRSCFLGDRHSSLDACLRLSDIVVGGGRYAETSWSRRQVSAFYHSC